MGTSVLKQHNDSNCTIKTLIWILTAMKTSNIIWICHWRKTPYRKKMNYITVYRRTHSKWDKNTMKTATYGAAEFAMLKYCQEWSITVEIENARNIEVLCGQRWLNSLVAGINGKVIWIWIWERCGFSQHYGWKLKESLDPLNNHMYFITYRVQSFRLTTVAFNCSTL